MRIAGMFILSLLIIALGSCNGCNKPEKENSYQTQIRIQEEKLQILQREREADSLLIVELTDRNEELKKSDSLLRISRKSNTSKLTEIKKGYAKTNYFSGYQSNDITRYFTDSLH